MVPKHILGTKHRRKEEHQKRFVAENGPRGRWKEVSKNTLSGTNGVDISYIVEEVEEQAIQPWDTFRAGSRAMEENMRGSGTWTGGLPASMD